MSGPRRWILAILPWMVLLGAAGTAGAASSQPLLPPLSLDPLDFEAPGPVRLDGASYRMPDGDRIDWYRLEGWYRLAPRLVLGGGLSYAGLPTAEGFRYGGGPAWVDLTFHLGPQRGIGELAVDILTVLPFGDAALYPVSSKAPSVEPRVRLGAGRLLGGQGWVGWFARRVSPPSQEDPALDRPDRDWPSGSGLMAGWQARHPRWDAQIQGRWDRAGLPESVWVQALATWYPGGDLGLRLGLGAALGPADQRPMDRFWSVGLSWRPPAPPRDEEAASSLTQGP